MTRSTSTPVTRHRRKKIRKKAKGYFGFKRVGKTAKEQVMRSSVYAHRDRKNLKRENRRLLITRLAMACRENGLIYSQFMNKIKLAQIHLNRKQLSEMAIHHPQYFSALINKVQNPWK